MGKECIVCGHKGTFRSEKIGTTVISLQRTLMECIIKCVPNMANFITTEDLLCSSCKMQLLAAVRFHEQCSNALTKLEARKNANMINLNSFSDSPAVPDTRNLQSIETIFYELEKDFDNFEKELDGATKELETISNTLEEKYRLDYNLSPETINVDLATDNQCSNVGESKPYESAQILEALLTQEQENSDKNSSIKNEIIDLDSLEDPIEIPKISILSLQEAWKKERLAQVSLTEFFPQTKEKSSKSRALTTFRPSFKQWDPHENNPVFLSCSGLDDNLFKLSLDLNTADVRKVFVPPLRPSAQKRLIFLGSLNVANSMIKKRTRELGFTCIRCGRVCDDEREYTIHYYGNHKKKCPECENFKPRCMAMLRSHYDNAHVQESYACPKCKLSFKTKLSYEAHIERYADLPACYFQCEQCREKFKWKSSLEEHLKNHNTPKICEHCAKEFYSTAALTTHVHNVHAAKTICPVCGNMYSRGHLQQHMRVQHNDNNTMIMCDQCPKTYKTKQGLRMHKLEHHGNGTDVRKPYCALCDRTFSLSYSIKTHNNTYHNRTARFKCEICKEHFARKDYWKHHMKMHVKYGPNWRRRQRNRRHRNEHVETIKQKKYISSAPVLCTICNKVVNGGTYKTHYNNHLNYRPFKCKHCPMRFFNKPSATKHEKLHDDPTYNLSCRICYNKFDNKDLLSKHLKKHESKHRYACNICSKKFGRMYLLEIHKVNDHAEEEEIKKTTLQNMLKKVIRVVPEEEIDEYVGTTVNENISVEVITDKECSAKKKVKLYND